MYAVERVVSATAMDRTEKSKNVGKEKYKTMRNGEGKNKERKHKSEREM